MLIGNVLFFRIAERPYLITLNALARKVAHGFVLAMKSEKAINETFNITAGQGRSIKEYAEILSKYIPGVRTEIRPAEFLSPERGALDITKAKKLLGYTPGYSIENGIKKYVDFVRSAV